MKKLVLSLFLLSSLFVSTAYAQNICFAPDTAKRMLISIEKTPLLEEQITLYQSANKELEYQILLLKEINILRKEQIEQYEKIVKLQKESYESIIKESRPSIWQEIFKAISYIGIGALIGATLAL